MKRTFNVVIEKDTAGYFVGIVPELPGCHSQARNLDELSKRMKEAIELYIEVQKSNRIKGVPPLALDGLDGRDGPPTRFNRKATQRRINRYSHLYK